MALNALGYLDLRFADETGFSLLPNVPYGWLPRGKQCGILANKKRVLNLFGLMSLQQDLVCYPTSKSINAQFIVECLDNFAEGLEKTTVVVLDQASWHRSVKVQQKWKEWQRKNLFIFFLPRYSPHLNAIEILWRNMKYRWLKPKDFLNAATLKSAIFHLIERFGTEFCIDFSMNFSLLH